MASSLEAEGKGCEVEIFDRFNAQMDSMGGELQQIKGGKANYC